ncbi:hypothetical protein T310_10264 [Rasamsonia emersonii CBS 393.64]|uniref:Uncharacterized protein n=1 Tax=Rasamsonia emersonii (strain ATCC 16479 / CBS 393.64 / IMI 116815) TaxID=1408163 RepID=A0A0F4YD87_RASE3|nr:hypothetical protein T310_10264 [Rasamsonia emersonii CBS 393.64]KKA16162.1 hypothetical protein T310_10264 [Rasamsonia emersonii CBS 393.64]
MTLVFTVINTVLLSVAIMCLSLTNKKKKPSSFQLTDHSSRMTDSDFESRPSALSPRNRSRDDDNNKEENAETGNNNDSLKILSERLTMQHEMISTVLESQKAEEENRRGFEWLCERLIGMD